MSHLTHPRWYDSLSDWTCRHRGGSTLLLVASFWPAMSVGIYTLTHLSLAMVALTVLLVALAVLVCKAGFHGISRYYAVVSLDEIENCHDRVALIMDPPSRRGWTR